MQLRRVDFLALVAAVGAAALPYGVFDGDAGRLLVTFMGLVAASILPSITLLMNSMTKSVGSVKAINDLNTELTASIDALLLLMGLAGIAVFALISLAIPSPAFVNYVAFLPGLLSRIGQATVAGCAALTLLRVSQIPAILRRSLAVRHKIALDESRRSTLEKAPGPLEVKSAFPTTPGFGKTVTLSELRKSQTEQ